MKQQEKKIKNPLTGRLVNRYGKIGKSLFIVNPQTGREVLRTGAIGKRIIKQQQQITQQEQKTIIKDDFKKQLEQEKIKLEQEQLLKDEEMTRVEELIKKVETKKQENKARKQLFNNDLKGGLKLIELKLLSTDDAKKMKNLMNNFAVDDKIVFKFTMDNGQEKYITMKSNNRNELFNMLVKGYLEENEDVRHGSDVINQIIINGIKKIELIKFKQSDKNIFRSKDGSFFKYLNTSNIDLTRYQIIRRSDDIKIIDENCLIYALRILGVGEELLSSIKSKIQKGAYVKKKDLKIISEIIMKNINLHQYKIVNNKPKKFMDKIITDTENGTIELCLYDSHYFIYEEMNITKYAINNYLNKNITEKIKNENKASSLYVIKKLKDHGVFKDDIIIRQSTQYILNNDKSYTLDNVDNEQELYEYNIKTDKKEKDIFFADTETDTTGIHTPILIGVVKMYTKNTLDNVRIYERTETLEKMICEFLSYVINQSKRDNDIIIYFHNLKYDLFALLSSIYLIGVCEKDNSIYSTKIIFRGRIIEFRDTYKLASMKLSDFNKAFSLPKEMNKKEYIAYEYYNVNNMKEKKIKVKDYTRYMKSVDIEPFYKLLEDEGKDICSYNKETNTFNPIEYYIYYLKYDCLVLCEGMKIFNKSILEITDNKMCVFNYLTISSLTNSYFGMMGAFDGVYKMTGCLRDFVSNAITGGRVQLLKKTTKKVIKKKIADYDAVSLYPSAIYRLCEEKGLPLGKAKKINDFNNINSYDYFIINIRITKINKKQNLPFISYKDDNGILQYTDKIPECGFIDVCIDKTTLQDYKEFHKIEYTFLYGVYWNEGFNKKMGECVYNLFNERLRYKTLKNDAMQLIIKLMLNSSYGKTIIKKSIVEKKIIKNDNIMEFIDKYYNQIKEITELNKKQSLAVLSSMDKSYNLAHVGVSILSMSKRIMNEVFNTANDNNINLYYTDTDSIHLNYDDIKKLEDAYMKTYNRVLHGKNMGQFHVDFDLKGTDGSEIYATESIFLGKKSYIDKLECVNRDGSITKGYHFRLKGMTTEGIIDGAKQFNNDIFEMFKYMTYYKLELTLNPINKFMIEYVDNQILTRPTGKFTRTMKF